MEENKKKITIQKDEGSWVATREDFEDLQQSPAGFGDTPVEALYNLFEDEKPQISVLVKRPGMEAVIENVANNLKGMQALVGGSIEVVLISEGNESSLYMVCNEEGKLSGLPINFFLLRDYKHYTPTAGMDPIVGTAFFCAYTDEGDPDSITPELEAIARETLRKGAL